MFLSKECEKAAALLKSAEGLKDCLIIKAFPYVKKPTRLKKCVIAVSPALIEGERISLEGEAFFGEYTLSIDIFSPQELGSPAVTAIAEEALKAVLPLEPVRIKAAGITAVHSIDCFKASCEVTFKGGLFTEGAEEDA